MIEKKASNYNYFICIRFFKEKNNESFYKTNIYEYNLDTKNWTTEFARNFSRPIKLSYDLIEAKTNKNFCKRRKAQYRNCKRTPRKGLKKISISNEEIVGNT